MRGSAARDRRPAPRARPARRLGTVAGPHRADPQGRATPGPRVVRALDSARLRVARTLVQEYAAALEIDLGFQGFDEEIARFPGEYVPPGGAVLIAYCGRSVAGAVALRRWRGVVCEMKRLYVRPAFRGRGVGQALAGAVIRLAADVGYRAMRLDTLPSMTGAIRLYRGLGFREIPPYRYNPVPDARFFELRLARRRSVRRGPASSK
jgi:putative acetyltransferase